MDPVRNPFAPGAGTHPPALVGRDEIIENADIALQRILLGKHDKSQILLGLRGVGKTVLLNTIEGTASRHKYLTSYIEAQNNQRLVEILYPQMQTILRKLSLSERAKTLAYSATRALRSFASAFNISIGEISISVDPEPGVADSKNLELDLIDLFLSIGAAAKADETGWALLIDEVQYLTKKELAALIVAIHRVNQKNLPILFFGAGLPQIAALSGDAKSYAERLFDFPRIGPLGHDKAIEALQKPIEDEGETIEKGALNLIVDQTGGYPYFLQEWGYQAWNTADVSPIKKSHAAQGAKRAIERLDASFFLVRYERLTPREKEYVMAMAHLGGGPYKSGDVADALGTSPKTLGPLRSKIISKGMIYSPGHGDIDFTVPMFDDFLRRLSLYEPD